MRRAGGPDRRAVALGLAGAAGAATFPQAASAQLAGIEVIASGPPGGGQDQLARAIAEGLALTKLTPRAITVNVGRDADALDDFVGGKRPRAAMMVVGLSTIGSLRAAGRSDLLDVARPLARVLGEQLPIVVPAESKFQTIADLAGAIRADASRVVWAGRLKNSADHLLALRLTKAVGGDVSKLAYKPYSTSAEASAHVLRNEVTVGTGALLEFAQQIRGGTLRALAIGSPERAAGLDVPTLKEGGIDVAEVNWRGLVTRDAIGRSLIERYGLAVQRLLETPGWRDLMRARFWVDMYQPAEDFTAFIASERARVKSLLADAGAP